MEYVKDFDGWNKVKKFTEQRERPLFHEKEIWWCLFGVNVGSEQDGEGKQSLIWIQLFFHNPRQLMHVDFFNTKRR
jgi:hypothetical protein